MRSKRQELACERNWARAQIKGACSNLRRLALKVGRCGIEQQLVNIEVRLLKDHDDRWNRKKQDL